MNKLVLSLLLALSGALTFGSVLALPVGKVTRLMTKVFRMCPERKEWLKLSTSLPVRSPSHIDITQIFLCTC